MAIAVRWLTIFCVLTAGFWLGGIYPSRSLAQLPSTENKTLPTRRLKVGVKILPPFVINRSIQFPVPADSPSLATKQRLEFVGIDIAIWEAIAAAQTWEYDYLIYDTVDDGMADLETGRLDILLGGLEITPERLSQADFSQPYYFSDAALLVKHSPLPFWTYFHPFLKIAALTAIVVVLLLISLFAHLIWLAERRTNPDHFPPNYWDGMRQAYWFAAVTMTTVGYGDTVPITSLGRRLTFVWMWVGMVLSSSITAALASGFTLSVTQQLETGALIRHHPGQKIAVIGDTLSLTVLKDQPISLVQVETFNEAVSLLNTDQVTGILYFDDALAYFQQSQPDRRYELIDLDSVAIAYGFALRLNDPRRQKFNISLLEMMRNEQLRSIINKYIPSAHDGKSLSNRANML
ncbi:MAG: transporter substrate-binding domain-containing protein [Synechocystis sp.]